jgi:hypothetical protein
VAFWDKNLHLISRLMALGELKERHEHTGKDGAPLQHVAIIDPHDPEFKALPPKRIRRIRECINGIPVVK